MIETRYVDQEHHPAWVYAETLDGKVDLLVVPQPSLFGLNDWQLLVGGVLDGTPVEVSTIVTQHSDAEMLRLVGDCIRRKPEAAGKLIQRLVADFPFHEMPQPKGT